MRRLTLAGMLAMTVFAIAGCGGGSSDTAVAPPPENPDAPATGTLKFFAYGDTVVDPMLDPFRKENPDLDLKVATFDSNKAAAAKLAGGFEADVVEVCTDEMQPLLARGLLRPLDAKAVPAFDKLAFSDSEKVRDENGDVLFVPASAGPQGLIVNTDQIDPAGIDSWQDLFDPAYAGNAALEATPLTALGAAALALGLDDPMNLSDDEVEQAKKYLIDHRDQFRAFAESDASMVNLFKSGEVVIADGGRGTAQSMIEDGVPVEWIAPKEGALSWVCGLAITSRAQNLDAAYKLINYYASPEAQAVSGEMGFVAMNPDALPLISEKFKTSADPTNLQNAIPQTEPPNVRSTTGHGRKSKPSSAAARPSAAAAASRLRRGAAGRPRDADPVRAGADAGAVLVQRLLDHLAALGGLHHPLVPGGLGQRASPRRRHQLPDRCEHRDGPLGCARHAGCLGADPAALSRPRPGCRPQRSRPRRPLADHRRRRPDLLQRVERPALAETIALMHLVVTFPLVVAIVSAGLIRFQRSLEEAAIDLGASQRQMLRYVVLPQIGPSVAAASIFAFAWSFNNFEISFFTGGFEQTFPSGSSRSCGSRRTCRSSTRSRP